MVGTEISRCAAAINGRVEHAAEVSASDPTACTPTPTRRRVNWSITTSTPVALEHDELAPKEVHAPQAVCGHTRTLDVSLRPDAARPGDAAGGPVDYWRGIGGVLSAHRSELLLEHHDERLTGRRLDLAIRASSGAQKTQDNCCTICCTIPDRGASSRDH
jgi:hypothetical protein